MTWLQRQSTRISSVGVEFEQMGDPGDLCFVQFMVIDAPFYLTSANDEIDFPPAA